MKGAADESVGAEFSTELLEAARDRSLAVILEAAKLVSAGMSESEARQIVSEIQTAHGAPKSWHPSQIRFGENTLLPFGKKGLENPMLAENDVFFFDIGPLFDGHEGDVGRSFSIGSDPEMIRCCSDAEALWFEVRNHWSQGELTGAELYAFARRRADARGWMLNLDQANGHRIADFPHAARSRGSIEGFEGQPAPNRWILEIQIRHPSRKFGAFYEDLLK